MEIGSKNMGDKGKNIVNVNSDQNKEHESVQDGGPRGASIEVTSAPVLFLQERSLFGFPKANSNDFLKHEEMYMAVGAVINPSHITGLQRVNGLWRIYVENLTDKAALMVKGVTLRGRSIPVLQTNPFVMDYENVTRIRIQNIPLSADDNIIKHQLVLKGLDVRSCIREKLRIGGRLTNCSTGDRLVNVKSSTLKEPLDRFMQFGIFKAKVIHKGQVNPSLKCSNCLEIGHAASNCKNPVKCLECKQSGHKKGECNLSELDSDPDSDPDSADELSGNEQESEQHFPPQLESNTPKRTSKQAQSASPEAPNSLNKNKRKKKKAKPKDKSRENSSTEKRIQIQKNIDAYFKDHSIETPNKNKQSSITRSPVSPLDDPRANTKKACT